MEYPGVAQMVARLNGVQEAAGSNPVTRTMRSVLIGFEDTPYFFITQAFQGSSLQLLPFLFLQQCLFRGYSLRLAQ